MNSFAAVLDTFDLRFADTPIMVCQEWSLDELGVDDEEGREAYRRLLERGFVPCQVYSTLAPDGEYGYVGRRR